MTVKEFAGKTSSNEKAMHIMSDLMLKYKLEDYEGIIEECNELKLKDPESFHSRMMQELYINVHLKQGNCLMENFQYEEAKTYYEEVLKYELELLIDDEISVYEVYNKLVDVYSYLQMQEEAMEYNKKAKNLMRKMMASKEIENIFTLYTEEKYSETIVEARKIEVELLDTYNKARYYMVIGNSLFQLKKFEEAIMLLEKALVYYEEKTYNSLTLMIYEELSKCYANIDEHGKAVAYMNKSVEVQRTHHNSYN